MMLLMATVEASGTADRLPEKEVDVTTPLVARLVRVMP